MNQSYFTLFLAFLLLNCSSKPKELAAKKDAPLISYVNPFIGTGGHGHTYPGATLPFGMMQLSPDTRLDGWDGCSGYHYSDSYIYGFSHTHLSGTGVSDYGDILLMPTNKATFNNGANDKQGYRAHFSHNNEIAEPGFYSVLLDSTNINVELTVSKRSGIHKYEFPNPDNQYVILDLEHRDMLLSHNITQKDYKTIQGHRHSKAWATNQRLFYYMTFSEAIDTIIYNTTNNPTKAAIRFNNPENNPLYTKIAISAVDTIGAQKNLEEELDTKTFSEIKAEAQNTWEQQLEKIIIESNNNDNKTNFYTSLYHTMIAPNLYQDVDGRYRGMDLDIHKTKDFEYYTVFSLWDTYRATHPLYTIIEQDRTNNFINTFLAKYDEGGIMPIWDLSANYTGCMIGYHAVPVIADAYLKGIKNYNTETAFNAMKHSATRDKLGLKSYKESGFIPVEEESESVSKTLEYAYDDWTIAQMAKAMGKPKDYKTYIQRAQNYKNVFDPETQFMRGRFRNTWFSPFDPYEVNFNYTEANSWQYSYYVPQDISGFTTLLGGKHQLETNLDKLFTAEDKTSGRHQVDITGLIGQYAHGNEPSHHMAYLYNFVNKPYKTQEKVHQILTELYTNAPDGISGNEDCGQMSAWYVFSSLGFYPVTPASNTYIIGTPLFDKATITLENKKQFTVLAKNLSKENKYIQSATLNGKSLNKTYINHSDIINGGLLIFEMSNQPSSWGTQQGEEPVTKIDEHFITPAPFIAKGDIAFKDNTEVTLKNVDNETTIFYKLNNSDYSEYTSPFTISKATTLSVYAEKNNIKSSVIVAKFNKINTNLSITLESQYANQYNGGGNNALIDGVLGTTDFRTGTWQGYHNTDLIAVVDLGKVKSINTISINFLQDQKSWIFFPTEVECWVSDNLNRFYKSLPKQSFNNKKQATTNQIKPATFNMNGYKARYIKIKAKTLGELPTWHLGHKHDGRSWLFADEITIK
ncbi:GH92 family glycosyl hydrolase [Mangrovimonas cancribranchiae]|uniref:GH92 family glycosyl hydrolase n=1 Tax=Mangrovimonas cancribranchiae TaxID=3080055 RepID=A0AAU6NWQ2_9FLAO